MEKGFVEFKTAKLAKNKGFEEIQKFWNNSSLYKKDGSHTFYTNYLFMNSGILGGYISAPMQSFLQTWLRKEKKIIVEVNLICVGQSDVIQYKYVVYHHWKVGNHIKELAKEYYFNSYEEALEAGLVKALKQIK